MTDTEPAEAPVPPPATPPHKRRTFLFEAARLVAANFFNSAMQVCIGIATIRIWGVEARGQIETVLALPGLLSIIFDLGLGRAMPYMIGKKLAPMDRLVSTTIILWAAVSAVGVGIVLAYAASPFMDPAPNLWLVLALAYLPLRLFGGIIIGFCVGVQRLGFLASFSWIREPLTLAMLLGLAAFPALRQPEDAWVRIFALNFGFLLTMGMGIWLMHQYTRVTLTFDRALLAETSKRSFTFGLGPLCLELLQHTPSMLLTVSIFAVPKGDIGNYTVGTAIAMLLMQLAYAVGHVLMSRSVHTTDHDSHAHARRTFRLIRVGVIGALAIGCCMAIVAPFLVPLVYGRDTSRAAWIMMILIPGVVGFFALHTVSTDLIGRGRALTVAAVAGPALVLNIGVCAAYTIPTFGIWGAATTTAVSYIAAACAMVAVYLRISGVPAHEALTPRVADFPIEQVLARLRRGI